jgi:hypothetical protein
LLVASEVSNDWSEGKIGFAKLRRFFVPILIGLGAHGIQHNFLLCIGGCCAVYVFLKLFGCENLQVAIQRSETPGVGNCIEPKSGAYPYGAGEWEDNWKLRLEWVQACTREAGHGSFHYGGMAFQEEIEVVVGEYNRSWLRCS